MCGITPEAAIKDATLLCGRRAGSGSGNFRIPGSGCRDRAASGGCMVLQAFLGTVFVEAIMHGQT